MGKIHVVEDIYLEADRYGYTVVRIGMRRKGASCFKFTKLVFNTRTEE